MPAALAIATVGSSIYGANKASSAAKNAAKTTAQAAADANALQKDIYDRNTVQMQPTINAGNTATSRLSALLGLGGDAAAANDAFDQWMKSTGYQFQFDQGQDAINSNRAARGLFNSGATAKALTNYGQNMGRQYFGNYLGQLTGVADRGTGAAGALAGVGMNYAQNAGNNLINAANTTAQAGITGAALGNQAIGQGLGALSQYFGSSYGGGQTPYITPSAVQSVDPFKTAGLC